jgi:hypothetical protein
VMSGTRLRSIRESRDNQACSGRPMKVACQAIVSQDRVCEPVGAVTEACARVADTGRGRALAAAHLPEPRWVASAGGRLTRQRRLFLFFVLLFLLPPRGSRALRDGLVSWLTWSRSSTE